MKKRKEPPGSLSDLAKEPPFYRPEDVEGRLRQVLYCCDAAPMFALGLAHGRVAAVVEAMLRGRQEPWPSPRERFAAACREAAAEWLHIAERAGKE